MGVQVARINIEDGFWSDDRFLSLIEKIGNRAMAAGALLIAIKTAQKYWMPNRRPIPVDQFRMIPCHADLIFCGLAEEVEDGDFVYIKGSEDHFGWLISASESGKRGGDASARARSNIPKTHNDTGFQQDTFDDTVFQQNAVLVRHEMTGPAMDIIDDFSKPPLRVLKPPSSEFNPLPLPPILKAKPKTIPHSVRFDFEKLVYEKFPRKIGKQKGLTRCKSQIKTQEAFDSLVGAVERYAQYCRTAELEPKFIKHFDSFIGCWQDWADPDAGTVKSDCVSVAYEVTPEDEERRARSLAAKAAMMNGGADVRRD